jgi:HEAT repeat protein
MRNELLDIIESKSRLEPERLCSLLAKSDEQVNLLLAPIVANLGQKDAARIYLQMTRHESAAVRKIGLDSYMKVAANPDFSDLFHLLGDEDARVRGRIIRYFSRAEPETAGLLLIRFLEQAKKNTIRDQKQVIEHYRALAACCAISALPFLEKTLLESKLTDMFSNSNTVHIKGAALALKTIGSDEALAILKKGGQSMRPDVRLACQNVLKR